MTGMQAVCMARWFLLVPIGQIASYIWVKTQKSNQGVHDVTAALILSIYPHRRHISVQLEKLVLTFGFYGRAIQRLWQPDGEFRLAAITLTDEKLDRFCCNEGVGSTCSSLCLMKVKFIS